MPSSPPTRSARSSIDAGAGASAAASIVLRAERVGGLLGMEVAQADQVAYLERLGFGVAAEGRGLVVTVPPDRHYDVSREVDLIEEVARVHGIDKHLPSTLPAVGQAGGLRRDQHLRRRAEDALRDLGFDEVVGWSFTDPGEAGRLRIPADDPRAEAVAISNPLSEDQSVMRTTLLGSLLAAAQHNLARGAEHVALFESGRTYLNELPTGLKGEPESSFRPVDPLGGGFVGDRGASFVEVHWLGALAVGSLAPKSWRGGGARADFFVLKGVLEGLAARLGVTLTFEPASEPFLHPGRSAAIRTGNVLAGWVGELHPLVCRQWDLEAAVGFEVELAALVAASSAGEETFEDVTTFPSVRQDLAVVVPADVSAAQVRAAVFSTGGELLREAEVFDLYEGEQVEEGHKSLALRLEFRAADRTLTDEEVAAGRESIATGLGEIGGSLRE